ncbi:hypothetical protein GCM10011611_01410 [Aliidongia dinghuensis]|uniref:Flp family type IVb pilin n=1 Tax=Aliidongia dinghuensis TaxID=1867774 RepID=A0A8J2YPU8_9PROT|nr:Flp family type IVb pilin [Aliidongia dinghuensis]GGE99530.1 hypothetical protein GCM10011611_01410 [Aliidongia dinghuensis]
MNLLLVLRQLSADQRGVSAVEYALLAALIALAIIGGITAFGTNLAGIFTTVGGSI